MAYDPKAVKIGKDIKRQAATITDRELRNLFMKSYVKVAEDEGRLKSRRGRGDADAKSGTVS
jgi:hypothetical protein